MSDESKDLIRKAQLRAWAETRGPWEEASKAIFAAFEAGDDARAKELYHEYMESRRERRSAILNRSEAARND